jgi:hypothetical protein
MPSGSSRGQSEADPALSESTVEAPQLGTLQGELRLPEGQQCDRFRALDDLTDEELFQVDVERAQVRDHRYSFLQQLPPGEYALRGVLDCDGEVDSHQSLVARFSVTPEEMTQAQFRFFFDVDSDLANVDLLFCAELALEHLNPWREACVGDEISSRFSVNWLREDCRDVNLQMRLGEASNIGPAFSVPDQTATASIIAPDQEGELPLIISLTSPEGGEILLHEDSLHVQRCESEDEPSDGGVDRECNEYTEGELGLETWRFEGDAYWDEEADHLVLTEPRNNQIGGAFQTSQVIDAGAVDISFLFYASGGSGADGIAIHALDFQRSEGFLGSAGGCLGYAAGLSICSSASGATPILGWNLEIDTWFNSGSDPTRADHVAFTLDAQIDQPLLWAEIPDMEDGQWHTARVQIQASHVFVSIDDVVYLDDDVEANLHFPSYIGFTATTGGYHNHHFIDELSVTEMICQ